MSDTYYREEFFLTDEDQDIWNQYQRRNRFQYIPLLKVALLKRWRAILTAPTDPNEIVLDIRKSKAYITLKTQMQEASTSLAIQMEIVKEEEKEARGGSFADNLKVDLRKISIQQEMNTIWSIPQAMKDHEAFKEVIESWKNSNDTMLVALFEGRPIYDKEAIEDM